MAGDLIVQVLLSSDEEKWGRAIFFFIVGKEVQWGFYLKPIRNTLEILTDAKVNSFCLLLDQNITFA